ncbi:hypothetical protein [Lacipirellula parvula]|uniref:Uncharacterized protein n=1 Tax=Lacipirellula parvula TaxID=2650471 RepID=A0A5K7X4W4_9BACT|nr:hypothetical protein [Lacipirellula parvula]BBO31724.1 hypothetical protein PLANPX_1336 [Lacipirellula parvula]
MNGVWRSLLWKEWREQRFKLLAIVSFTIAIGLLPVLFNGKEDLVRSLVAIGFFCLLALGLFVGASLAASEQSQRTVGFLQSLPQSTRRTAIAKLLVAALTVAAPGVVLFGVIRIWESVGYIPADFTIPTAIFVVLAWATYSFAIWVAAIAVNLADEVRAGAVGFLAIALFWGAFGTLADRWSPADERVLQSVAAAAPGGPLALFVELMDRPSRAAAGYPPRPIWHLVLLAGVSSMTAAAVYVWRFGRVAASRRQQVESAAKSIVPAWLAPPMRKPWIAIVWKQCCESLPLALLGAGGIFCVSLIIDFVSREYQHGILNDGLLSMSIPVWLMIGGLVSIVSGIGLWLDDLRPELNTFWRSRPISTGQWFAVKFVVSALITLATLSIPSLLIYGLVAWLGNRPPFQQLGPTDWPPIIALGLLSQFGFFSAAAAFMAATRRPMISALLTIFTAAGVAFCVVGPFSLETAGSMIAIAAISALATAAGWLCIRNDWAIGR